MTATPSADPSSRLTSLTAEPIPASSTGTAEVHPCATSIRATTVALFVVLREGVELDDALVQKIRTTIRANTTPRHVPAKVIQVADIPRTISGKIVELAVRNVVHGKPVKNQEALANPEALKLYENLPQLAED